MCLKTNSLMRLCASGLVRWGTRSSVAKLVNFVNFACAYSSASITWSVQSGPNLKLKMAGFANGVNDVGLVPAYVSMEKLATSMFPTLRRWYENSLHFWLITTPAIYLYLAANESRKTVRGTKALKAKDRVTVVFCPFIDRHVQNWSSSKKSTLL